MKTTMKPMKRHAATKTARGKTAWEKTVTIGSKKYDKAMIDAAKYGAKGDGVISKADSELILKAARPSGTNRDSYDQMEKATMAYIRKNFKFTDAADKLLRSSIAKLGAQQATATKAKRGRPASPKEKSPAMKAARRIDPVAQKVMSIQSALPDSELPRDVTDMLIELAPKSLAVFKNERHRYEEEVIQMIGQALKGIEAKIQDDVSAAEATVGRGDEEKANREAMCAAAEADLNAKHETANSRKSELADDAIRFKETRAHLRAAEVEQETGNSDLEVAASDKDRLDAAVRDICEPLKAVAANKAQVKALQEIARDFDFDSSLGLALPGSLTAAVPRSGFADVVIQQLDDAIAKQVAILVDKLEAGAPQKAARAAAVHSAQEAHEVAKTKQIASAAALKSAQEAESASQTELKSQKKALSKLAPELAKVQSNCARDTTRLSDFRTGALEAFNELLELMPPPEPEPEEEKEDKEEEEEGVAESHVEEAGIEDNMRED